ncbi:MAG TPA: Mut7-C RNAse domain-containing protein [Bryobacteraceae bacterium]|nr:Mut7-C RNAse domain-containing protein [Bryobacteraceae bacterium]
MAQPKGAAFRFYAELNGHLGPRQRYQTLEKSFYISASVKDMIEGFGVPHTEVDLIVANGQPVDFSYQVQDSDRIAVYPVFESFDISGAQRLRPQPLRNPRFILDVHLGRLAAYLRMLGFDSVYERSRDDAILARISADEHRILLTRDRGLLKHGAVTHGYWVRETNSRRQIGEVMDRFSLAAAARPFTRCMACNGVLKPVSKDEARSAVPERALDHYDEFRRCSQCVRIFWKGSHYARMQRWIAELTGPNSRPIDER